MSFLPDTDTCSAYLKGNNALANRFIQYGGRLHLSAASLGELYTWAFRARASSTRMQRLLDMLPLVSSKMASWMRGGPGGTFAASAGPSSACAKPADVATATATIIPIPTIGFCHFVRCITAPPGSCRLTMRGPSRSQQV